MTFFESLLILMLAAIVLLQISRRLSLPYPALLAAAGIVVALVPGSPAIEIEPQTYLALFIAPVLVDAAYDFPPGAMRRYFGSLMVYAIVAVALTAGVVAYIAHATLGLPIAAGIAIGAVVAPPDAAAATAILRRFSLPSSTSAILQGESLFNDSTALLLYGGALTILSTHALSLGGMLRLGAEIPGGLIFGVSAPILESTRTAIFQEPWAETFCSLFSLTSFGSLRPIFSFRRFSRPLRLQ